MEVSYGTRRIATKYNDVPPARCIRDVGHYGRLVFAMVARHFLSEGDLIALLQNPDINDHEARSLYLQVQGKDYITRPAESGFFSGRKSRASRSVPLLKIRTLVTV
jgi:hypothetical protein